MVIEVTTLRLASGAEESAFLEADARLQTEFMYGRPGLLRRTTARGADREWLVLVLWRSEQDAEAATAGAGDHPAVAAFDALVDGASVRVSRYEAPD